MIEDSADIANTFKKNFVGIDEKWALLYLICKTSSKQPLQEFCIWLCPTNVNEVEGIIMNLENKNSSGFDLIRKVILQSLFFPLLPSWHS